MVPTGLDRLHGFLLVDKPEGITSQDVITRLQRVLLDRSKPSPDAPPSLRKRDLPKMGHGGTLDPFATGLLVLAVGDGTKLARYLLDSEKTYEATVVFGARTSSGDRTNDVVERTDARPSSRVAAEGAARDFLGKPYLQTPPMYSAKKIDGKPLYELARKGIEVDRAAVECAIRNFEVAGFTGETASIRVAVSSGTYVRTLAEDWAERLGTLAHLTTLRRLASGPFRIEDALSLAALEERPDWSQEKNFIPFDRCLREKLPAIELEDDESRAILEGRKAALDALRARLPRDAVRAALYHRSALRAVFVRTGEDLAGAWDFERVFPVRG